MKNRFYKFSTVFAFAILASFLLVSCSDKEVCPKCGDKVDRLIYCPLCETTCCENCTHIPKTSDIIEEYQDDFVDEICAKGGLIVYDWSDVHDIIVENEEEVIETIRDWYDKETIIEAFYDIFVEYTADCGYVIVEAK